MLSDYNAEVIRRVLDGGTLEARKSVNDKWVTLSTVGAAIRYLVQCNHSPAYCRIKPKPITKAEALVALEAVLHHTPNYKILKQFIEEQP